MRIITGCLRPNPTDFLPVLSGIAPTSLRRKYLVHRLAQQGVSFDSYPLNKLGAKAQSFRPLRLKSFHLFSRHAAKLLGSYFIFPRHGTLAGKKIQSVSNLLFSQYQTSSWSRTNSKELGETQSSPHWSGSLYSNMCK